MKIITATHIENKTSTEGTSYQIITDGEGNKYGLWKGQMEPGLAYEVDVENKGKYHNIKSFTKVADKLPQPAPVVSKEAEQIQKAIKVSSNKSYALSYAKDISCALISAGKQVTSDQTIETAKKFQEYLDS